jgi:hypothetical protein
MLCEPAAEKIGVTTGLLRFLRMGLPQTAD